MRKYRVVWIVVWGLVFFAASHRNARCNEFDLHSLQSDVFDTIDQVRPAVVRITGGSTFSGVIVSADGHVVSVAHAVSPGKRYQVTLPDGRRFRGVGQGSNSKSDSALVKILDSGGDLPYAPMGDSSSLVPNQPCIGLSYPSGQRAGNEPVVRFGRFVRASRRRGMLQTSVLMEPGDSGGPVFDLNGCVIGIRSRIGRSMQQNYEVPINVYREFWSELNREQAFEHSEPSAPRLGIRCVASSEENEKAEGDGLVILSVKDDSLAFKAGLSPDDRIVQLYGRPQQSIKDLREAMDNAWDDGVESIKVQVTRSDRSIDLEIDLALAREIAPRVSLPENDHPVIPAPRGFKELERLANQLADLEAKLDDACVTITSDFGEGNVREITGTLFRGTRWVVSKNSVVGQNPTAEFDNERFPLAVIDRDTDNDLVLLESPEVHRAGIKVDAADVELSTGAFLLTPDDVGGGFVSIVGSPEFRSPKQDSRGFLGVVPATYQDRQGALLNEVIDDGAAKSAGLLVGDVITQMNDTSIRSQNDLRRFLSEADPHALITAALRRGEDELTKSIMLEGIPPRSDHAANKMAKSGRRDGFQKVYPHDADLDPRNCGGPLFDLDGNLVGLNIARHSRVRTYALPVSILREFMRRATSNSLSVNDSDGGISVRGN
ncbi:trypsin-like peptidase domain-containing protein [Neorhodopirellula lusitana]|uniref:trypsin-like peptidase domain-containing protein n=1 Tax=Neorhodopirellula lusitana TaxID=445327 RepID=UPI00384AF477